MKKGNSFKQTIILLVICILFATAWINNKRYNSNEQVLEFNENILEDGVSDNNVSVRICPRGYKTNDLSSWYHTYHVISKNGHSIEHSAVGTIYEMTISNLSSDIIADYNVKITMPRKTHFNSGWNGIFEIHQNTAGDEQVYPFENATMNVNSIDIDYIFDQAVLLIPMDKGDYFSYEPSILSDEVPIAASKKGSDEYTSKIIGFITYTDKVRTDYAIRFSNGEIRYTMNRKITKEPLFWIACIAAFIWVITLLISVVVSYKMRKVEKERQANEALIRKFETDDLTGTYTRQAFLHYADELRSSKDKKYAAILLEVDNFGIVQSQYGEKICNEFLIYLADYLKKLLPEGYVGRYSRARYAVIYEIHDDDIKAENLIDEAMIKASPMPNQVLKLGVYSPVDSNIDIARIFDRAALALTKIAGKYGQNIAYYDDTMESKLIDDHNIEEYMDIALEEKQFVVYYQPKHDANSKKLVGAEALVRWTHPQYGFMNPGQFIPIFEKTGFITKLDAYVFEKVCNDIKEWNKSGVNTVPISINFSRKDFYEDEWIDNRLEFIDKNEIDINLIHVEITESIYAEDMDEIRAKIGMLKDRGIKIEMDDFGSGYSSLGMLTSIPLDILKLDMSFVRDIENTGVVVESIIELAHKLGFTVVSEGVENEMQYDIVRNYKCDCIQGFYFAKPMTKDEFEKQL